MEILEDDQQGAGAGTIVLGYRMGMLTAGAGALWLASVFTWNQVYTIMGIVVVVGMITILLAPEPRTGGSLRTAEAEEERIRGHLASGMSPRVLQRPAPAFGVFHPFRVAQDRRRLAHRHRAVLSGQDALYLQVPVGTGGDRKGRPTVDPRTITARAHGDAA